MVLLGRKLQMDGSDRDEKKTMNILDLKTPTVQIVDLPIAGPLLQHGNADEET